MEYNKMKLRLRMLVVHFEYLQVLFFKVSKEWLKWQGQLLWCSYFFDKANNYRSVI